MFSKIFKVNYQPNSMSSKVNNPLIKLSKANNPPIRMVSNLSNIKSLNARNMISKVNNQPSKSPKVNKQSSSCMSSKLEN
jgi:hypothetical protein